MLFRIKLDPKNDDKTISKDQKSSTLNIKIQQFINIKRQRSNVKKLGHTRMIMNCIMNSWKNLNEIAPYVLFCAYSKPSQTPKMKLFAKLAFNQN